MQASLFDQPQGLRRPDSPAVGKHHSSAKPAELAAAKAILPKSGTQRHTILRCVVEGGQKGRTQWEVILLTDILRSSVCGRMNELEEEGWVRAGGTTKRGGSLETVYFASTRAIRYFHQETPGRGETGWPSSLPPRPAPPSGGVA